MLDIMVNLKMLKLDHVIHKRKVRKRTSVGFKGFRSGLDDIDWA